MKHYDETSKFVTKRDLEQKKAAKAKRLRKEEKRLKDWFRGGFTQ